MSTPLPHPLPSWRERALALFPAGSNGEYHIPPDLVPVLERGHGPLVWDTEGDEWLDVTMAWGSALVGHGHPKVLEAAMKAAHDGFNFAAVNRRGVELAERIHELSPCAERVRFVASGTEATMLCLRIAHAATGRPKVLRFLGAYHGQHPVGVAGMLGDDRLPAPQCDASGAGAPWAEHDVLVAPFNDLTTTLDTLRAHAHELAAVIVEPFHRCLKPLPGFLAGLREATTRHGIPLIFDEVVTGFRFAPGGAQEYYGVIPDLVAYGKALGGGFPIGAYAGRAELMEVVAEDRLPGPRYAWSASTTGGNPVSCAAALAALNLLCQPGVHEALHRAGDSLRQGMLGVLRRHAPDGQVLGDGPIAQFAFAPRPITDHATWRAADRHRGRAVMLELLRRRVFLNPLGTKLYLSIAHQPAHLDLFLERFDQALAVALAGATR
ncbi:MAG: aminotransferase class III-fold pyridoxal phosphate-dependent enzyme [Verrucomicrobiales bacterium]|nr:aminotransferase class III-fold pyridoxal phosphate-dependent enzyme [Verrucomicrobiales bacterium]